MIRKNVIFKYLINIIDTFSFYYIPDLQLLLAILIMVYLNLLIENKYTIFIINLNIFQQIHISLSLVEISYDAIHHSMISSIILIIIILMFYVLIILLIIV